MNALPVSVAMTASTAENDESGTIPAIVAAGQQVMPFPREVPIKFAGKEYFVRDCYPEYYRLVMELLSTHRGVSVSGTPGIGKSVFMGYFYQEYRKAHPNATIIMAHYSQEEILSSVVIKKGGEEPLIVVQDVGMMEEAIGSAAEYAVEHRDTAVIRLLGGRPDMFPHNLRWVSFTDPDDHWSRMLLKNMETVQSVYMPVWSDDELLTAAVELERDDLQAEIDDAQLQALQLGEFRGREYRGMSVLDARFALFGGVPCVCFETDALNVRVFAARLKAVVDSMTLREIIQVIESDPSGEGVHGLLHYIPLENKRQYRIEVASGELERFLVYREPELFQGE